MPYSVVTPVLPNDIVCMCKYSPETNCQRAGHDRHSMTKPGTEMVWEGHKESMGGPKPRRETDENNEVRS